MPRKIALRHFNVRTFDASFTGRPVDHFVNWPAIIRFDHAGTGAQNPTWNMGPKITIDSADAV